MTQILIYRQAGFSNKEIAQRLNIATNTVKAHVAALSRRGWRF
jgi:DNA-binding NarL/FixJ family response regulator